MPHTCRPYTGRDLVNWSFIRQSVPPVPYPCAPPYVLFPFPFAPTYAGYAGHGPVVSRAGPQASVAGQSAGAIVGSACSLIGAVLVPCVCCVCIRVSMHVYVCVSLSVPVCVCALLWVCVLSETFCYHNYGGQGCQGKGNMTSSCCYSCCCCCCCSLSSQ